MVGDRKYDVTGAAACGVPCLGVYYGYAEPGELEAAGAAATVQTVAELSERLLQLERGINEKLPAETCVPQGVFCFYQAIAFPSTRSGSASEISRSA